MDIIHLELSNLCAKNLARGHLSLDQRLQLITTTLSLKECIAGACHIQECVFEDKDLKRRLFADIDKLMEEDNYETSICSSTSVHLPSVLFADVVKHKSQCLVAHPINPPLYVRLVELVPHADTREEIVIKTRLLMDEIGQKPVVLNKEISGFALNRIQFAVFQQAFRLVHDGIMTPLDIDTVVSEGLGPRYAFIGPWMTAHLNANGVSDYFDKFGEGIYNISKDSQSLMRLEGEAAQQVTDSMLCTVPLEQLNLKRAWRDKCLLELSQLKDKIPDTM